MVVTKMKIRIIMIYYLLPINWQEVFVFFLMTKLSVD